jgi:hypothetical protein
MTEGEALDRARRHVLSHLKLVPCASPPQTLYGFNAERSFLFILEWPAGPERIGSSTYLAVSRETGDVTIFSGHGE